MRRALLVLPILAAAAAGWWWSGAPAVATPGWLPEWAGGAAAEGPRLRTAAVDRGPITAIVTATGTVNPVLSVQVGTQLSGQIRELAADFNTRVTAGQPLAKLDTRTIEARQQAAQADLLSAGAAVSVAAAQAEKAVADLASARAQLLATRARVEAAEAQLRDAEAELRRTNDLRARGVTSEREASRAQFLAERMRAEAATARAATAQQEAMIQAAEAAARTAAAQVEAARATEAQRRAQLAQVEVDLANATIRAPIDGVVISRNVDLGQTVAASLQSPILFLIAANLEEMEVWATVDESEIGRIRPGQEVSYTVAAHPGVMLRGRVKEIRLAAQTVQNVVTYTVVVATPNAGGRLLPGMTATLRVTTDQRQDVLRLPNAALRWRPAGAAGGEGGAAPPGAGPIEQALRELTDLTPAQRTEIAAAQAELRERMANLPGEAEARRQQSQAARQRLVARFNAVLTPEQRARLAELRSGGREAGASGTVWVLEGGAPRAVPVRTGLSDGSVTELLAGEVAEGASVVVGAERVGAPRSAAAGPRPF